MKDGRPVNLGKLEVIIPLGGDGGCKNGNNAYLRDIEIKDGAISKDFVADDIFSPGLPVPAGTVFTLCGEIRIVPKDSFEYNPILVGGFTLDSEVSRTALRMDLVPDPSCAPDCPITRASKATIELGGRESKGQVALVAKLDLRGVRHGDTKVTLGELGFFGALRPGDLNNCLSAMIPDLVITGGRATRRVVGAGLFATWPQTAGMTFSWCTGGLIAPADPEVFEVPWLSVGFVVGDDPAR